MGYRTLRACVDDLAAHGRLVRIEQEIDPRLEAAAVQRRVFQAGGPAIYFARVKGCSFPMVSNLFGTLERARWIFRDTLPAVRQLVELKVDPSRAMRQPRKFLSAAPALWHMLPRRTARAPALACSGTIAQLPHVQCWPDDGGAFITLPQVYSEHPDRPGWQRSNLGMYRVQISGGKYQPDREIGLHYQIQRGIGVHHAAAVAAGKPLPVHVYVGGAPAMTVAAVMPLPEALSELSFAGALSGHRVPLVRNSGELPFYAEADFTIAGTIDPDRQLPEGPFGDHLGYYSLAHDFPVLRVERVFHRPDAIWPFTVVGRPPQEDTAFGQLIHELTGPAIPSVLPGVKAVHAVDAAGVHPLLLAIGSERYTPYAPRRQPAELLTQANALLGQGQLSLAKYLLIVAAEDNPALDIHDIPRFFRHLLERVDWQRDLHFQTCTTIDTLDYSGTALNEGSKLVIAATGPPRRSLPERLGEWSLPEPFGQPRLCLPGVVAVQGPAFARGSSGSDEKLADWVAAIGAEHPLRQFPLAVVVDDSEFVASRLDNFLWAVFTRSNPATDVYGVDAFTRAKHWGCAGPLVIDARSKPHHAPALVEDPAVERRVDALGAVGGPLHGII